LVGRFLAEFIIIVFGVPPLEEQAEEVRRINRRSGR